MPELPEVETVKRSLIPQLVGRTFLGVKVRQPSLRRKIDPHVLNRDTLHCQVIGIRRRSKYLLIDLVNPSESTQVCQVLAVHLGMTGWFGVMDAQRNVRPHDHVIFTLDNGQELRYHDARRFGSIDTFAADKEAAHVLFSQLGVEPLDDKAFTAQDLWLASRGVKRSIKSFLLDGKHVVGVGNIYACEALWRAGIHPGMLAMRLSRPRAQALVEAVVQTLGDAIQKGGTTLRDFSDAEGSAGMFAPNLSVYGKEGGSCHRCSQPIKRMVQQGRSTFFCRGCQKR